MRTHLKFEYNIFTSARFTCICILGFSMLKSVLLYLLASFTKLNRPRFSSVIISLIYLNFVRSCLLHHIPFNSNFLIDSLLKLDESPD